MTPSEPESAWLQLMNAVRSVRSSLQAIKAERVGARGFRDQVRSLVQLYFIQTRPTLVPSIFVDSDIGDLDDVMQELLRLSNGRSQRNAYRACLNQVAMLVANLDSARLVRLSRATAHLADASPSAIETRIIDTIASLALNAALSYQQALRDLNQPDRLSHRGTVAELREAYREVIDHLAPDNQVVASFGYRPETGTAGPTQRQKAKFILQARGLGETARKAPLDAVNAAEEAIASLTRSTYQRGAQSTHGVPSRAEVMQLKMYVDAILCEILVIHEQTS